MQIFQNRANYAFLAFLSLGACEQPPDGTSSSTTDTGQVTTDGTSTTSSDPPPTSTSDDSSGSTTGETLEDPCLAFPPEACPPDCAPLPTYPLSANACGVVLSDELVLCVSAGEPLDPDAPTTFYAEIDGQVRYIVANQPCAATPAATPIGWTECTNAPDAPEACACLCGADGCSYEADLLVLEACGLDDPCGPTPINDISGNIEATEHDLCVLAALRDRTPGAYGSYFASSYAETELRVFLDSSEKAQFVVRNGSFDTCWSALNGTWKPTQTCTLQPPEWFDACITDPTLWADCLFGYSWFADCVDQPASCP
jgi:hypothetical protein